MDWVELPILSIELALESLIGRMSCRAAVVGSSRYASGDAVTPSVIGPSAPGVGEEVVSTTGKWIGIFDSGRPVALTARVVFRAGVPNEVMVARRSLPTVALFRFRFANRFLIPSSGVAGTSTSAGGGEVNSRA